MMWKEEKKKDEAKEVGDLVEEVLCRNGRVNEGLTMGSDDIVRN